MSDVEFYQTRAGRNYYEKTRLNSSSSCVVLLRPLRSSLSGKDEDER
jgi:hypothetical protein